MKLRASLIELWNRVTDYNLDEEVYLNGANNLYPNEIELVVQNSPSASKGSNLMSTYINGRGLTNDPKFNGKLLSEVNKDIADDISVQYGCFIHVAYGVKVNSEGADFVPTCISVLDYTKCRKSKNDDNENAGIIIYKDFEESKSGFFGNDDDDTKETWYYPFSNNQEIIKSQIRKDNKEALKENPEMDLSNLVSNYRGQVYYLNLTPKYTYAISHFNSVYNDCDTEYRMSLYSNSVSRAGFLGKVAILTSGLDEETSADIKNDVAKWLGAENASTAYFLEIEDTESLDNNFKIMSVPSQYDEAQFKDTKENTRINILGACNNIPSALVSANDSNLFGNSGELIVQMKSFYNEQTNYERRRIEETYAMFGIETKIIPLINNEEAAKETIKDVVTNVPAEENTPAAPAQESAPAADAETLKAQAGLRGSVGGVNGILGIQNSVTAGTTDRESAITILMEIYGFTRGVAEALLGKPILSTEVIETIETTE
ncbi:hypothetical protein OAB94_01650 [Flavobacteriaceae bacterium]|nr:hypothetical protein [Flavobacteriaceae bacterium]MDB9980500.1 hypothetical protein [bacterium]